MRRVLLVLTGVGGLAVVGHLLFVRAGPDGRLSASMASGTLLRAHPDGTSAARSLGWVPKPARWDGGAP